MRKSVKAVSAIICAVILAAIIFQVKVISLENGEHTIVYMPLLDNGPGASSRSDLTNALIPLYGEEGVQTEGLHCSWQGESATVYDTASYEIKYLGRSLAGGDYLSCKVTTVRTVLFDNENRDAISDTRRTCVYIGYDDADMSSTKRAEILWETLKEEYSDSEAYFNGI